MNRRNPIRRPSTKPAFALCLAVLSCVACCAPRSSPTLAQALTTGEASPAIIDLQKNLPSDRSDRSYILDRMRLLLLGLLNGTPDEVEETANQTFALLSTQGINADKTVSAAVINERVKIWKGEPFEQALAFHYIAVQKAQRGEWDNARAAASSSLFRLKDFGDNERGGKLTSADLARRAAQQDARSPGGGDAYLDKGYVAVKTDFALGYLMNAVSNLALGRIDEAADNFREAQTLDPSLAPLCSDLSSRRFNTVLIVDYGVGPMKVAYGPDDSLARFQPRQPSDGRPLSVTTISPTGRTEAAVEAAAACDVNIMAQSLMWNNLEDVRRAKSFFGNAMMIGGTAVAIGANDSGAQLAGLAVAVAGLLVKASARADTRSCELLPRSIFVVPVSITEPSTSVLLEVPGDPRSRLVLTDLSPPPTAAPQLRYARLVPSPGPWASAPEAVYANARTRREVAGGDFPYIMGGRCVRFPSPDVMDSYHRAGNLKNLTAVELESMYREEGITFTVEDQRGRAAVHILEGGTSLVCPLAGTTGYKRLFGQTHPPYRPRSRALRDYLETQSTTRSSRP